LEFYLSFKEVWRNRSRFFLFSLVIALITVLVLFIAALAEGLANANRQYLEKLNAELIVFQKNVDLSINASRIDRSRLSSLRRVDGVVAVGSIGFSSASLFLNNNQPDLNISLIGVEPGQPGSPPVIAGRELQTSFSNEAVIDGNIASRLGIKTGDLIEIKSIQGTKEQYYQLLVVGETDGRQFLFQPSLFVPFRTWDRIRPQANPSEGSVVQLITNVVAVKLANPADTNQMIERITNQVSNVEVVDRKTAYESVPGYKQQQSTLNTQQLFTFLIGVLVIGGFFQIQILQKVPLIGVLKAIGASNHTIGASIVLQIMLVTTFGVLLGSLATVLLSFGLPDSIPIYFSGNSVAAAVVALLLIGPLGGLVSVRHAIRVEPLIALGLSA
jgi:putative ABC transport system permease protein